MTDLNAVLHTAPVWRESVDTGGMFPSILKVHHVPDRGFLSSFTDGWTVRARPTWHDSLSGAQAASRAGAEAFFGLDS